jgi:hypothetical protein
MMVSAFCNAASRVLYDLEESIIVGALEVVDMGSGVGRILHLLFRQKQDLFRAPKTKIDVK